CPQEVAAAGLVLGPPPQRLGGLRLGLRQERFQRRGGGLAGFGRPSRRARPAPRLPEEDARQQDDRPGGTPHPEPPQRREPPRRRRRPQPGTAPLRAPPAGVLVVAARRPPGFAVGLPVGRVPRLGVARTVVPLRDQGLDLLPRQRRPCLPRVLRR